MKIWRWWWVILILLTACEGDVPQDPEILAGMAEGMQRATDKEINRQNAQLTQQAAILQEKSQAEINLINAQLGATQTVIYLEDTRATATAAVDQQLATATAQAGSLQATATSGAVTATAISIHATATQEAFNLELQARQDSIARRQMWTAFLTIFGFICAVIATWFIVTFLKWKIEWTDRKNSIFETRQGTVVIGYDELGYVEFKLLSESVTQSRFTNKDGSPIRFDNQDRGGVQAITASGSVLSSPMGLSLPKPTQELALQLVKDAEEIIGSEADVIPGWRALSAAGWNSDRWKKVIRALEAADAIEVRERKGTFLKRYNSLFDLEMALMSRTLILRPPSPTRGSATD